MKIDKVDAVFTATVQEVKPITPIFKEAKIPLLTVWDSNNYLKTAGNYIFTTGFGTEDAAHTMAEYAYNSLKLKNVAIITHIDEWTELITNSFKASFEELGGKIVLFEKSPAKENNYRTQIAKAKNSNADGIYFPMIPPAKGPFLKQVRELGYKGQLMTGGGFLQSEIDDAGFAADNVYYTNLYAKKPELLAEKYKTKYGSEPYDIVFASFGYDALYTLWETNKISKSKNISLRDGLSLVDIVGVGGPIKMQGGQYSEKREKLYKITNGKSVEIKTSQSSTP